MIKEFSKLNKVNQVSYAIILNHLMDFTATTHELAAITGLHLVTLYDLFRVLRRHKVVHIVGWEQDALGRDVTPVFSLGRGRDKPRRAKTVNERARESRQRKRIKMAHDAITRPCRSSDSPKP